jgi:hypothetical protein
MGAHRRAGSRGKPRFGRSLTLTNPRFPRCLRQGVTPYKLASQSTKEFIGGRVTTQDDPESPGSDEPHHTNPRCLGYGVIPCKLVGQLTKELKRGYTATQGAPESPGSDGASPYQPALPRLRRHPLQKLSAN